MFCVCISTHATTHETLSLESHDAAPARAGARVQPESLTRSLALPSGGAAAARLQSKCAGGRGGQRRGGGGAGGGGGGAVSARGPAAPRGTRGRGKARFSSFSSSGYGDLFATLPLWAGPGRMRMRSVCP